MTSSQPIRPRRAPILLTGLATLGLTLSACGSAATLPQTPPPTVAATAALTATLTPTTVPAASPMPAAGSQPQTIHLSLRPINDTVGSLTGCASAGSCQGDFMVGYDPLIDAETGKTVGTFAYECFLVDVASTLYHCPGVTITLTGRGQIVFTELIEHLPGKPPAVSPITGGTGEFLGATGTVTAKVLSGSGDFVIAITR